MAQPRRPFINTSQRFEWINDITLSSFPSVVQLPNNIVPNDRFMFGMLLQWEGRITNPGANNPTGTQADAPFGLIDTVVVQGTHRIRGQFEQFINARGPDLRELGAIYTSRFPLVTPASLNLGPNAVNDIRFTIPIYFVPMGISLQQQVDWLLDAPNYDALRLIITAGDDQNIFTYGTRTAPTFSAFGSSTGSPRIRVGGWFAQAGKNAFEGFVPGRVWRYFNEDTSNDMTSTGSNVRLQNMNIPRGQRIRGILLKTGTKSTAVASGDTSYATLSNSILANIKIMRGTNKPIRFYADYTQAREDASTYYSFTPDTGFALVDFAPHGTWFEAFDLTAAAAGPTGDVDCFLQADVTGASNQAMVALWEELRGNPLYPVM